jgi:anti-anti-sigma regulatory factor
MTAAAVLAARTVTLGPGLEIREVEGVCAQLRDALAGSTSLTVDLSQLRMLDTAGVQLLLALRLDATRRGVSLTWRGDWAVVRAATAMLGLTAMFPEEAA